MPPEPVPRALRVETPSFWRRPVRPAVFAALVVSLFVGGDLLARALGLWHSSITVEAYERSIQNIDSPEFTHLMGEVPSRAEWEAAEARTAAEKTGTIR